MKESLIILKNEYFLEAVFLGTRRTDPYSTTLEPFAPSTTGSGWPSFMRVLPILDFNYSKIWDFFSHFEVQFCKLYSYGYTYLGNKDDSIPNPFLMRIDGSFRPGFKGTESYEPFSRTSNFQKLGLCEEKMNFFLRKENILKIVIIREHEGDDSFEFKPQYIELIDKCMENYQKKRPVIKLDFTAQNLIKNSQEKIEFWGKIESSELLSRIQKYQHERIVSMHNNR